MPRGHWSGSRRLLLVSGAEVRTGVARRGGPHLVSAAGLGGAPGLVARARGLGVLVDRTRRTVRQAGRGRSPGGVGTDGHGLAGGAGDLSRPSGLALGAVP